ncbi:MAG: hypothetical protein IJ525_05885 [Alphaproteobacteria bacterium]|nr:hypothetical protein [Alphaproteobacteria bacterium]
MRNFEIKNNDCHAALAMTKSVQSGRSMIEMLGVLAIIGVLSVGGIAGYSKAMQKYRINKTIEQITLIAGNVRAFWGPQKNYIGVYCGGYNCPASGCMGASGVDANGRPTYAANGCPIVKKAKIFPDEMITVTDGKIMSITNPFGGGVDLSPVDKAKNRDNQAFEINYDIVDNEEACIELASRDWSNIADNVIVEISKIDIVAYVQTQFNVYDATMACSDGTRDSVLHFTLRIGIDPSSEYWKNYLESCSVEKGGC